MRRIIDFFNHGIFPFIGRSAELDRLVEFWQGTIEAEELRAALLIGEAGMGKSRLVDSLGARIRELGGALVHIRLYPGATSAVVPLIARSLGAVPDTRALLRGEPAPNVPAVTQALGRLCRLRPTLLIIEDIHLPASEATMELVSLLSGLSDEPLSVLGLTRPYDTPARRALNPYVVEEVVLQGLGVDEIAFLWKQIFGTVPDPELPGLLHKHTLGNPLALRSALRGALKGRAFSERDREWHLTMSIPEFEELLMQSVRLLSEGMAAHLNAAESRAASHFAALGEAFSFEAAERLEKDAERLVEILTFKGILGEAAPSVSALCGKISPRPLLAFTHTLLHRNFVEGTDVDPDKLFRLIVDECRICSILPFELIAQHCDRLTVDPTTVRLGVEKIITQALLLDTTSDWAMGIALLRIAGRLSEIFRERWEAGERRRIELEITETELQLLRREIIPEQLTRLVERMAELTNDPLPGELLEYRLACLRYRYRENRSGSEVERRRIWDQVEELLKRRPDLRPTRRYLLFLRSVGSTSVAAMDSDLIALAEKELLALLKEGALPVDLRTFALKEVAPVFLWSFASAEELEKKLTLLKEIEAGARANDVTIWTRKLALLEGIGLEIEALQLARDLIPRLRNLGLRRDLAQVRMFELSAEAALGLEADEVSVRMERIIAEAPPETRDILRRRLAVRLGGQFLQRDMPAQAEALLRNADVGHERLLLQEQVLLALAAGRDEELEHLAHISKDDHGLHMLLRFVAGVEAEGVDPVAEGRAALSDALYLRAGVLRLRAVIDLLERCRGSMTKALHSEIQSAVERMIHWLTEHHMGEAANALLLRYDEYLTTALRRRFRSEVERLRREHPGGDKGSRSLPRLSMLGRIEVTMSDGAVLPIRGARLRTLLGLMTLRQMLADSMTASEFRRLASGREDDPEGARKIVSMALLRLREMLGEEVVIVDGDVPELNLERVDVDLLEAHRLLQETLRGVADRALYRARPLLLRALEITRSEVPFPTLYDDLFESAREDFDYLLRTAVVQTAQGLITEGDEKSAEDVLRRGFETMPEDEEIVELFQQVLNRLGRRTEAERVGRRFRETIEE